MEPTCTQDLDEAAHWGRIRSICPECMEVIPAVLTETDAGLVAEKHCSVHGPFRAVVASDLTGYLRVLNAPRKARKPPGAAQQTSRGCPNDCGLCPSHDQHTCLAIVEITSRCNLACPVCLAASDAIGDDLEPLVVESALKRLLESQGDVTPLQLSGGEPTVHPQLLDIVRRAASLGFKKIEIDTNGIALAHEPSLASDLLRAGVTSVYLQLDGLRPSISRAIRGADLVEQKLRAIELCKTAGLQVVLSVTVVPGVNDRHLWEMIRFGMEQRLTGVNFQSVVVSGRSPESLSDSPERFTLGHFLGEIESQSGGKILASDLTPIPCSDPRCAAMMYALIHGEQLIPLNRVTHDGALFDHIAELSDWDTVLRGVDWQKSPGCGCSDSCGGGSDDPRALLLQSDFFSVGYHGMMDACTLDLDRASRCCVHKLTSEGQLIPFCLYNIKYRHCR